MPNVALSIDVYKISNLHTGIQGSELAHINSLAQLCRWTDLGSLINNVDTGQVMLIYQINVVLSLLAIALIYFGVNWLPIDRTKKIQNFLDSRPIVLDSQNCFPNRLWEYRIPCHDFRNSRCQ
jgi:hypothetical protein